MKNYKIGILTSDMLRHRYMVNKLSNIFDIEFIFSEKKQDSFNHKIFAEKNSNLLITKHMQEFEQTEKKHLSSNASEWKINKNTKLYNIDSGNINSDEVKQKIIKSSVDVIAVYGTSLLKSNILNIKKTFINIHLGLSPYYKGMACTFWPFYNKEPEYTGVTVHLLNLKIDDGPIIHQKLVDFDIGDTIHDGSLKVIKNGINLQADSIKEYFDNKLNTYIQDNSIGKTYYLNDMNDEIIKKFNKFWTRKNLDEYIINQDEFKKNVKYYK